MPLTLALVHFHPEPVDDCPCFEDAIAVLSCTMGSFVGHWQVSKYGLSHLLRSHTSVFQPGIITGLAIGAYRILLGESWYPSIECLVDDKDSA